jgi:hypothetical protein
MSQREAILLVPDSIGRSYQSGVKLNLILLDPLVNRSLKHS